MNLDSYRDEIDRRESGEDGLQRASDEEAQLLHVEQFDYEEDGPVATHRGIPTGRRKVDRLLLGPLPPRILRVRPLFPSYQTRFLDFMRRLAPGHPWNIGVLVVFLLAWTAAFSRLLYIGNRPLDDGQGSYVINLDCVDTPWERKNFCGLDGLDCRPFSNTSFAFRCPAKCAGVKVLNPHGVGPEDVVYRPLVIGDDYYRGDSFVCGSGIHSGVVSNSRGGCGRFTSAGQHEVFSSSAKNGIESVGFDSYFPMSFTLSSDPFLDCPGDPRDKLLLLSICFTLLLSICITAPALQFFITFTAIFIHVGLASDPPGASRHNISVLPDHVSRLVERFLPAAFCAVIMYHTSVRRSLEDLKAPLERTVLWLGGFWFGALSNETFDWIPIQRLTATDLQQPGAKIALALIVMVICLIVIQQAYCFWLEGRMFGYLKLYGLFLFGIGFCVVMPGIEFRLHHYVLALLLLPGTSLQTRSSLLYQGILLGLFANGIARWGFASVLETTDALRGDGAFNSALPSIDQPLIDGSMIKFSWASPVDMSLDGISVLVNDVERYRQFFADSASPFNFTWARSTSEWPEYFRFAYLREGTALDYTRPGTWFGNGSWYMARD